MVSCPRCGTHNPPFSRACTRCSAPLHPTQELETGDNASQDQARSPAQTETPLPPEHEPTIHTVASAQPHENEERLVGFLVSFDLDPSGVFFPLRCGDQLVGRRDSAPNLHIAVSHPTVSSKHAMLYFDRGRHLAQLEDLGSANGTLLNDINIVGQGRRELRDGDRVRFGAFNAVVKLLEPI